MELYPHQREAHAKASGLPSGSICLYMGMRTGKTRTAGAWVTLRQKLPCLIICPLSAVETWRQELISIGAPDSKILKVRPTGSAPVYLAKNKLLLDDFDFFIVNYESAASLDAVFIRNNESSAPYLDPVTQLEIRPPFRAPPWLGLRPWGSIVLDESQRIANYSSKIAGYLESYPKPPEQLRLCLSGTPAPEGPHQYAGQQIFTFGEYFGCRSTAEYMAKYWYFHQRRKEWRPNVREHLDHVRDAVQRRAFCVTMAELGLGTKPLRTSREVPANEAQKRLFDLNAVSTVYKNKETGEIMELTPGVRALRHRQIAAGIDPDTGEIISEAKILDFIEYQKDTGQQILVSSYFRAPIEHAAKLCAEHGIEARVIIGGTPTELAEKYRQEFQSGEVKIILGQEDKVARALEFSALDSIFILSASYSTEAREQLEERGQNVKRSEPYEIISQHTAGSAESRITQALRHKKADARRYLDQLEKELFSGSAGPWA